MLRTEDDLAAQLLEPGGERGRDARAVDLVVVQDAHLGDVQLGVRVVGVGGALVVVGARDAEVVVLPGRPQRRGGEAGVAPVRAGARKRAPFAPRRRI